MNNTEFIILTYEEEMQLSKEDFVAYNQKVQTYFRSKKTEIAPGYRQKTHEDKISFWAGGMNQQMRWQTESGLDPYAGYSPEWRENLLRFEPDLDALIKEAFERYLSWEWNYGEYLNRVG